MDPGFRDDIQKLLKSLHEETGTTFLMVTHDFGEALFLGERAAILNNGRIEQEGALSDVFKRPETPFVAGFVGVKNIIKADFDRERVFLSGIELHMKNTPPPGSRFVAIRAEDIQLCEKPIQTNNTNVLSGKVVDVADRGVFAEVAVQIGVYTFHAYITKSVLLDHEPILKKHVYLVISPVSIHAF